MSFGHGINCIIVKVTPSLVTKLFYNAEQALPDTIIEESIQFYAQYFLA